MKKFLLGVVLSVLLTANSALAMTFSQPVKIGMLSQAQAGVGAGGFIISKATHNDGDYFNNYAHNKGNNKTYGKGVAQFSNGEDALYVHYDAYKKSQHNMYLGGKDINNTIPMNSFCDVVYKITSDSGVTLYPIRYIYGPASSYVVLGKRKDGVWVKFIDSTEIAKRYLGLNTLTGGEVVLFLSCQGDTLIMKYRKPRLKEDTGEFRFKWDDKAQWFSVDHIVY